MNDFFDELFEIQESSEELEPGVVYEHFGAQNETVQEMAEQAAVYGEYSVDAAVWEKTDNPFLDGLYCEQYVAALLCDDVYLTEEVYPSGWHGYHAEYGCSLENVGKSLEAVGLKVEKESHCSIKDVCEAIDCGEKVICSVSSIALSFPELADLPGLTADSFVEVIGVDFTDIEHGKVIVNSPVQDQAAYALDVTVFSDAWKQGECYCLVVSNR
ncbi:MAG: hypothetical protein IJG23_07430 [Clostridia bacterium]|nr:hypothetical protein [Clostridia bacterium]